MLLKLIKTMLGSREAPADFNKRALEHYRRGELDQAERYFREAARCAPGEVSAWTNLGATLMKQQRYGAAVPVLEHALELRPGLAEAQLDVGVCHSRLDNNAVAIDHYQKAIQLNPDLHQAHANLVNAYLDCCDWDAIDRWRASFLKYRDTHPPELWSQRLGPFCALMLFPGAISKELARVRAAQVTKTVDCNRIERRALPHRHSKVRLGYVSADFYDHATAHLTFGLYEAHDRAEFEVYAYSTGPDDRSVYRTHIEETCDRFVDVRFETPERTAQRIADDEIDILIDMKGYTANSRREIFACRPSPVQVSYLGYPGTSGADFIDYFISDAVATPPGYEEEFTEKIVRLPDSYQVNDRHQSVSEAPLARSDYALPQNAFVYCSFNRLNKIDRTIFASWMEILLAVPQSVLWLIEEDPAAVANLNGAAESHGVESSRVVFSKRVDKPAHLARHRLADLFLDTHICNAHTGASDALWAGLPILTCPGPTFISRVAASLLHAAGLPELVAPDLQTYRRAAVEFGKSPESLRALRMKLEQNRLSCALFDTPRYVRNLEAAYRKMHEINQAGAPPQSISVTAHTS